MELITRTVYSAHLQTARLLRLPYTPLDHSTLNEKLGVQFGVTGDPLEYPAGRYFCIGNGGHRMVVGKSGIPKPEPVQFKSRNAALYNQIPFVLRAPNADLPAEERAKYALRTEIDVKGSSAKWIAYYAKRLDLSKTTVQVFYNAAQGDGSFIEKPFVPDTGDLNPQPPQLSPSGTNVTSGDNISVSAKVTLPMDGKDVTELLNVANILYGDDDLAIVSEVAFCSGKDKVINVPPSGGIPGFTFNEVIVCQVNAFVNSFYSAKFSNNGIELLLDLGATEPLLQLS